MLFRNPLIPLALDLNSRDPQVRLEAVHKLVRRLADPGFLEILRQQRLVPLLYASLSRFPRREVGRVPHLEELRRDYLEQLKGCQLQEKETGMLARAFAEAGVEGILLKGGDLRRRLYEDPVCRPMGDVDVLISPADLDKVRAILEKKGYSRNPKDTDRIPDFNRRFAWEELYAGPGEKKVFFDIHWEIRKMGAFYRLPYGPLRARATPGEEGFLILSPEHLLMNLCLHTLEEWEQAGVMKLVDLDRALTRLPVDWELFLGDAAMFRVQGAMGRVLREMAKFRPQSVPPWVLGRLSAVRLGWRERFILSRRVGSLLVASLATLGRHLPVREWPAYLKGKLWPDPAFFQANPTTFRTRTGFWRHLMKRTRDRT